ncbi:hypothetical protein [Bacillus thuringiensis]|uniref:40-residue YVTN family beta-propeller n=1 Tax=Bacillus thuringiensis serovar andalousiensis TaxID=257985 RepID=A0A6H0TQ36_BACTU|nr:hypothetical protein [Bacillus thuringiensis]QIW21386.1 hypothetical protein EVG22_24505 [Bacillus thuringiensis serovar andalousiensis]
MATNTVIGSPITVGNAPTVIAIANISSGIFAYITNFSDNTVSVINTTSNTVITTISVGNAPFGITIK